MVTKLKLDKNDLLFWIPFVLAKNKKLISLSEFSVE